MSALESATAIFPANVLECSICYNIPSITSIVLCKIGHLFCTDCQNRITQCVICQSDFETKPIINVLQKILTSIEIECKFKNLGCNENLNLEDRENHENHCKFSDGSYKNCCPGKDLEAREESCKNRQIYCFSMSCQNRGTLIRIGPMADNFFSHYTMLQKFSKCEVNTKK